MSSYQCKLLGEAEELFSHITFKGNDDFPYLINLVIFNNETLCYNSWKSVMRQARWGTLWRIYPQIKQATKMNLNFAHGKSLKQIVVDFNAAEYNGFSQVFEKDLVERLSRGCSDTGCALQTKWRKWCASQERKKLYLKFLCVSSKDDVMVIFDILCGKKDLTTATPFVPLLTMNGRNLRIGPIGGLDHDTYKCL